MYPDEPRLYQYAYSVEDDYEGAVISAQEASDEYATHGSYEVRENDGSEEFTSVLFDSVVFQFSSK